SNQGSMREWQTQSQPDLDQGADEIRDHGFGVKRRRRYSDKFGSFRVHLKIDRLDVNPVLFQQEIGGRLTLLRIADHDWNDVRIRLHEVSGGISHARFQSGSTS